MAYSSYVNQLYGYLNRDNIDLDADQADYWINYIYSNVDVGISRGYIYEIKEKESEEKPTEPDQTEEPATDDTTSSSGENDRTEGPSNPNTQDTTEPGTSASTEKPTEKSTSGQSGTHTTEQGPGRSTEKPGEKTTEPGTGENPTKEPDSEQNIEDVFSKIEADAVDQRNLEERVDKKDAEASAVIEEQTIIIDPGDGDTITLDAEKEIIPSSWTTGLCIIAIATCAIALVVCLVLIFTKCMRFGRSDRKKPQPGHRKRHKIRKVCRNVLMITTGISIAGLFLLIAIFASLFSKGRIEKNIQDSGYFRYAYIEYLSEHGRAVEGKQFLSDEEAAAINVAEPDLTSANSDETLLTYDEFVVREKQATQQILKGNKDVKYQKSNVAPYILRMKEDVQFPMFLSGGLFLLALLLGCVFTIFMDLRRDRGIKMIAISDIIGTVFAAALTAFLIIWSPAKRLFIEPDYLYLFFKNYMDWMVQVFAVISVFGLVLGMALIGVYMSRRKERSRK